MSLGIFLVNRQFSHQTFSVAGETGKYFSFKLDTGTHEAPIILILMVQLLALSDSSNAV